MPDEIMPIPIEQEELAEIYQVLAQIGKVVENEQIEKRKFIICPRCGQKISYHNNS